MFYFIKKYLFLLVLFISHFANAQNSELALSYFKNGEYEKAIIIYKPLLNKEPFQRVYFKNLLTSYQQTEEFGMANDLIRSQMMRFPNQIALNIELGYNYELQGQEAKAKMYYDIALLYIEQNPKFVFVICQVFKQNYLLDYALKGYQIAKSKDPNLNTEISEAQIYGEKSDLKNMFSSYLNLIEKDEKYYPSIQRYIATYITEDAQNETNILFKKLLLKRAQNNPNDSWNILLSWLYMQQKEYGKSLVQEKSLYKRNQGSLDRIIEVGIVSFKNEDLETSHEAFNFILSSTKDPKIILQAQIYLLQIDLEMAKDKKELAEIDKKFKTLFENYGKNSITINLQIAYANFLAFSYNEPEKAIHLLNETVLLANSKFQKGKIQIKLADILVYTNQFNQALILYSQVQTQLKNSTLAQTARFKVAQTSYYKGDFKWAQTQLKVLKSSTSQLIANDALDLSLLISNNIEHDSIPDALKNYAASELLAYQNNTSKAIDTLSILLIKFKGQPIEDEALFKQAELYTKNQNYSKAEANYLKIIEIDAFGVLVDDSTYMLAELYSANLSNSEKAKEMYQKIIFEYPSSIYLVDARKKFRILRGDKIP
jgi:tetratricopeptide (TPR) repeat protein